jgi:hypothetical protein
MNTFLEGAKLCGTVHGSGCVTYWNRKIGKQDSNIIRKLLLQKDSDIHHHHHHVMKMCTGKETR